MINNNNNNKFVRDIIYVYVHYVVFLIAAQVSRDITIYIILYCPFIIIHNLAVFFENVNYLINANYS